MSHAYLAGEVLCEESHDALERPQHGAVDDDWPH